jgi:tetratricopeptide (TPR) repeat protein
MSIFSKWFSNKDSESPTTAEMQKPQLSASDYCEQGQKSLDAGKCVEAMEYFQAAIEADKRFEKAYLLLALAYEKQGKVDKAKSALYGLLAEDPSNLEATRRIDELNAQCQDIRHIQSKPPVSIPQSNSVPISKPSLTQRNIDDDKETDRNIGCLLFAVLFNVICAIALFSMEKFWGGLGMAFIALFTIYGHFTNPDFWK